MSVHTIQYRLQRAFPALSHRNFRLFWTGQCISLIGTWMQNIGQDWLVLQLTHSPFKLGVVSAIQFAPMMFFALFAGAIADRLPKRKVLMATQFSLMILAAVLATLTYLKVIQYWHVLILAGFLGAVNTIDMPTRQSFFVELVGKEDLMNAIALNSTIFNLARIVGPAVAGFLIGLVGIAACFYLNALSFVAVLFGIWLIDVRPSVASARRQSFRDILEDTRAGLRYILTEPKLYWTLLLLALISLFVINFNIFVPLFAKENLKQAALGYGLLMTAMGVGSLGGALTLATRSRSGPNPRVLGGGAAGMSVLLILLGFVNRYWLAALILLLIGYCMISFTASANTLLQLNSDDSMRGRVMGLYSLVFGGVTPIGSLLAGKVAENAGISMGMLFCGAVGVLSCLLVYLGYRQRVSRRGPAAWG
ncbi:putative MFS family arabinose efflux permease [Hydrogenispora ethanolica]|uniref:Putative MFS family arabinose efflux permease n=1 Tax=Hydrogenispora ethanolica TaxID=1082276 RepID=A0A4R1QSF6_HYDET|nr:MFS transporter [Hydrogenispora ethanolica]TCL56826.1 putative MFS family arabinose efflux permease [Hydrogenispora ethanolica]